MSTNTVAPVEHFEDASEALNRVQPEADALDASTLSVVNLDLATAAAIVLDVAPGLRTYRNRLAALPEYDIRCLDNLEDYAKATWFAHISNTPVTEVSDTPALEEEGRALRDRLLTWSVPLVASKYLDRATIEKIKEGSGKRDSWGDLAALAHHYRARWDQVRNFCDIRPEELDRASQLGLALFKRSTTGEGQLPVATPDSSLKVRRCWTLLERAYSECRRGMTFLRWKEGDADTLVPNLRRNSGVSRTASLPQPAPTPSVLPVTPIAQPAPSNGPVIGGGNSPFIKPPTP